MMEKMGSAGCVLAALGLLELAGAWVLLGRCCMMICTGYLCGLNCINNTAWLRRTKSGFLLFGYRLDAICLLYVKSTLVIPCFNMTGQSHGFCLLSALASSRYLGG